MIRDANADDVETLTALTLQIQRLHVAAEAGRFAAPPDDDLTRWWAGRITAEGWRTLVAELDGHVVGYILVELVARDSSIFTTAVRELHIHHLGIDSHLRRQGVGRALVEAAQQHADRLGATQVTLTTWGFNVAAQEFFASCGYEAYNVRMRRTQL